MKSLNEIILKNLLQERNLALAKLSLFKDKGEPIPTHFTDRLDSVECAIRLHEQMILEDKESD
jgi:hypothetical protein